MDEQRSKDELIAELRALRARLGALEAAEVDGLLRVRTMLEQLPAYLWTADLGLRLTWSRPDTIIQGLHADPDLGVSIASLFGDDPEHPSIQAHRAALEGEARDFEVKVGLNGRQRWLRGHVEPLRSEGDVIRGVIGVALDITERVRAETDREELIGELRRALEQVKTLSGLIPICVHCKRLRDDQGYWQQVETFVSENSGAELSHGICPECVVVLMPGQR